MSGCYNQNRLLVMNQYNTRNRNNEPKVKDTYKLCMKESQGQNDGKTVN